MKKLLASIVSVALFSIGLNAAKLELISDNELESISAQGFHISFQTVDTVLNSSANSMGYLRIGNINQVVDSVMVSGQAQQNAFVPINAANSAVNVPINIVVIMNSHLGGGVNINNILNAAVTQ